VIIPQKPGILGVRGSAAEIFGRVDLVVVVVGYEVNTAKNFVYGAANSKVNGYRLSENFLNWCVFSEKTF